MKTIKHYLSADVVIFDIDSRELSMNKREYIRATDSIVVLSTEIRESNKQKSCDLPSSLYLSKIKDLETRIREYPKTKSESKIKAYCHKIREYYFRFFMFDLLDINNYDYNNKEIYLSYKRKKKLSKDHFDFLKKFSETQTFKNFQKL